jgi:aminopeptidase S
MYRLRFVSTVVLLSLLGFPASAQETERIREIAASIAGGPDREARRAAITRELAASGIDYELQEVGEPGRGLTNIIATVRGQTSKTILLGAHYDRVPQGNGVVDNGASCAVLLNLIKSLKARPPSLTVRVVFFDLEELGLLGSKAYFARTANQPKPAYAVNLDIFGYGDSFFITTANPAGPLKSKFQQVASEAGLRVRVSPPAQYPGSDHRSMIEAGIETLGIALIDGTEVDSVLNMVRGAPTQAAPPRILTIIHTASDTMDVLRLTDVAKGAEAVERFVRTLN